jgi:hypothetical protein
VPSNGTVVKIFTHSENDLDGGFYVHVRYDINLMIRVNRQIQDDLEISTFRNRALTPNMKMFVALRFYASGSFQGVIADTFALMVNFMYM